MNSNKELLFNLIKKLESGELNIYIGEDWNDWDKSKGEAGGLYLEDTKTKEKIYLVSTWTQQNDFYCERVGEEWKKVNDKFKENFYKEKGLDKCWTKNCSNKIYQKEGDYKKVKIKCRDKHTRMLCLNCAEMDAIDKLAEGEE